MTLNIKNAEAYQLARSISDATGESLTRVVIEALRARMEQMQRQKKRPPGALAAELRAIGKRAAELIGDRDLNTNDMYDERGAPK